MAKMVNIPRDIVDDYYRYKMPLLKAKVEGKGNGIKTVIENMEDIARALNRPPSYTTKYFGFELGALTKVDSVHHKYIVNGRREAEDLSVVLDSFIQRYVLCSKCRNPETLLQVKGESITAQCKACGKINAIDMGHKLSTYILRNPPDKSEGGTAPPPTPVAKKEETKAPAQKGAKATPKKEEVDDDGEKWSVDTSAAAVEARKRELLGTRDRLTQPEGAEAEEEAEGGTPTAIEGALVFEPGKNPIPMLQKYFASNPEPQVCIQEVQEAAAKVRWSDTQTMKAIFASLFDAHIRTEFYKKCDTLAMFVQGSKHEKIVLYCLEKLLEKEAELIKDLPHILHGFYEEAILSEDTLVKWFEHVSKTADPKSTGDPKEKKFAVAMKESSAVLIAWLNTAESESDEDFM